MKINYSEIIDEIDDYKLSCYPPHYPVIKVWDKIKEGKIKQIQKELTNHIAKSRLPAGLYINIPFCKTKCKFCYLKVYTSQTLLKRFVSSLIKEMEIYSKYNIPADSVYIAGGTSTLPRPEELVDIFKALNKNFNLNKCRQITIETSPTFIDEDKIRILKNYGVNLIMLGVQSFNDEIIKNENRYQNQSDISRAVNILRKYNIPFNIDLIVGLTEPKTFISDLYNLIKLKPDLVHLNKIKPVKDLNHKMEVESQQKKGLKILTKYGYKIIDEESASLGYKFINIQGDMRYQNNSNIIGIGPGSLTHIYSKLRYSTYFDLKEYSALIEKNLIPMEKFITISEMDEASFYIISYISNGIRINEIKKKFPKLCKKIEMKIKKLIKKSAVIIKEDKYFINEQEIDAWYEITKNFYSTKYIQKLNERLSFIKDIQWKR